MKKYFLLIMVLSCRFNALVAQNDPEPVFKKFGFSAGANFSHMDFSKGVPPPAVPIPTSWHAGLNIGFLMMVHIAGKFYFQPEYAYSQMGGKAGSLNTEYNINYFSLPLFLKCRVQEKIFLLAGPQFDLLINATKKVNGNATDITHDTEERSLAGTAGIEYKLTPFLSVCARYMYGFNHVGLGQRSNLQEFKYEMAQLKLTFLF